MECQVILLFFFQANNLFFVIEFVSALVSLKKMLFCNYTMLCLCGTFEWNIVPEFETDLTFLNAIVAGSFVVSSNDFIVKSLSFFFQLRLRWKLRHIIVVTKHLLMLFLIQDLEQVQELTNELDDIEKVHRTLETIQTRLPRCVQVITSLIPALFASVLRTGRE